MLGSSEENIMCNCEGVQETGLWRTNELIRGFNDLKAL